MPPKRAVASEGVADVEPQRPKRQTVLDAGTAAIEQACFRPVDSFFDGLSDRYDFTCSHTGKPSKRFGFSILQAWNRLSKSLLSIWYQFSWSHY